MCYLHNYLSHRQEGQGTTEELRGRDFRRELENWERSAREKRDKHRGESTELAALSLYIVFIIQHCFHLMYSYVFSCMLDYFRVSRICQTGMD